MAEKDAEGDAPENTRRLHVTVLLVASRRALDMALNELGFLEDDDRIIEHDGRLAFLTCTHETDCDDLFALISELSARGESWELQSRIDTEGGRVIYQSLARHRSVEAIDAPVEEEAEPELPAQRLPPHRQCRDVAAVIGRGGKALIHVAQDAPGDQFGRGDRVHLRGIADHIDAEGFGKRSCWHYGQCHQQAERKQGSGGEHAHQNAFGNPAFATDGEA